MPMLQAVTGPGLLQDGAVGNVRGDKTGAQVLTAGAGKYTELVLRGCVFSAAIPPDTGQAPGQTITTVGALTIGNPMNSGVNLVVLYGSVGFVTGTFVAGSFGYVFHNAVIPIVAPAGGTVIVPSNALTSSTKAASANARFNNTVPTAGVVVRWPWSLPVMAAAATALVCLNDPVEGAIIVGPGTALALQGVTAGAGTAPKLTACLTWAEIAI